MPAHDHVAGLLAAEDVAADAHRLEHVAVADPGLHDPEAGRLHRLHEAEVAHHRRDDGVVDQLARLGAGRAPGSPGSGRRRRRGPRGRRPGSGRRRRRGRCRRRAPCSTTAAWSGARWVEPQPSLMLRPSGSAPITTTSAPAARSAIGAASLAAPLAQSTTTFSPVERAVEGARPGGRRTPRPGARRGAPGRPRRRSGASHVAAQELLDLRLDGVVELEAAAGEELDAVVGHRVVRGADHHAEVGVRARRSGTRRPGVGSTRSRSTSTPAEASPATTACSRNCPEIRGSRPDHRERSLAASGRSRRGR